ncbi:hypothetical protein CRUP_031311 [Coryphaenoides rupestris]|nr:hypothetical protein CRUP_031311 [Coryphaenoides rupestris]
MRMRLTPDCSKMLISTSSGYLLILHQLDLTQSLEVGSYRMLRARRTPLFPDGGTSTPRAGGSSRHGNDSSKLHPHREGLSPRNSLEILTPEIPGEKDRGNCITSLQLHPKGWATLLRCSSNMDDQEELCFSPDGRLICSPYGYGVRLLAFDGHCGELSDRPAARTPPAGPAAALREVRSVYSHSDVVLTTKFSPTHCQLASGCLSGRVCLYQPRPGSSAGSGPGSIPVLATLVLTPVLAAVLSPVLDLGLAPVLALVLSPMVTHDPVTVGFGASQRWTIIGPSRLVNSRWTRLAPVGPDGTAGPDLAGLQDYKSFLAPLVEDLGGDTQLAQAEGTQPQLQVLGILPPLARISLSLSRGVLTRRKSQGVARASRPTWQLRAAG